MGDPRGLLGGSSLYVVSDARRATDDLARFLHGILEAGVDAVQLRDKGVEARDQMRAGAVFREAASAYGALFTVDDDPSLALAVGADGVHLGQNDLPVEVARRVLGPDAVVGLSCHSERDHARASREADYLTAGPVWGTPTKPGRPGTGLDLVRSAARTVERPWFAIGGIDQENVRRVVAAGARRIVVVRAVTEAEDPPAAVRALLAAISEATSG